MKTPICDFVRQYQTSDPLRLHMPGHKGRPLLGVEGLDVTEIEGADELYRSSGIIRESEENAAILFGAARTVYSAEGSSLCIRAMLYLVQSYARSTGRLPRIDACRNAHKSFINAAALLNLPVRWLYPKGRRDLMSGCLTPEELEAHLLECGELPTAVYVTSPDYLGHLADLSALSGVCHRHGVLLLVDNAHGAYLRFLQSSGHPMDLGADLCCDSAHKTLPVLTGGGYLHIKSTAPEFFKEYAEAAMALFASTSPSYLILQSLDGCNRYLSGDYRKQLAEFIEAVNGLKRRLLERGFSLAGDEPLKLTLLTKPYGYTGTDAAAELRRKGIVCEFFDPDYICFMLTPETGADGLARLESALLALPKRSKIALNPPALPKPVAVLSPHDALFSPFERLPVDACLNRILAVTEVSCPPAVPPAVSGERIDPAVIATCSYYGITTCLAVSD